MAGAGRISAVSHRAPAAAKLTVLVVDDDDIARHGMEQAVRGLGYVCSSARDGAEALERIAHHHFDVVLSDWKMPRLDGIGLCRAVRAHERDYTYFVFVAGQAEKRSVVEGMHAGADDYLLKPIDLDALEVRLLAGRRVLETRRALAARNRELRRDSERNFQLAHFDVLTGTRNRLALAEDMRVTRESLNRYGTRCAVAMCDIDKFKEFNDTFGHVRGDEVLRLVADVMQRALRAGDRLYRYGGEEFVVLLHHQRTPSAVLAMQRVRWAVESAAIHHAPDAGRAYVTISVGVTELSANESDDGAIRRADAALYRAKALGRNRVEG